MFKNEVGARKSCGGSQADSAKVAGRQSMILFLIRGARFRAAASIRVSGSGFGDDHRRLDGLEQVLEAIGHAIDL
jgi:hypothetical protein